MKNSLEIQNNKKQNKYKGSVHYDKPVNKWLRNYLKLIAQSSSSTKKESDKVFARKSGITLERLTQLSGGYARVSIEDLIKISKATGISTDEIIFQNNDSDDLIVDDNFIEAANLKIDDIELFSKKSNNVLYKHVKGGLFSGRDDFIKTLDYLISQEDFIKRLSEICYEILENFKASNNSKLIADYKDIDDFKNRFENKKLNKELNDIITNSKLRNAVRDLVKQYIYDHLK